MPIDRLLLFVGLCACLSACADPAREQRSKRDLYEHTVGEEKLLAPTVARYFSRRVIAVTSDFIRPGVYTPSRINQLNGSACADSGSIQQAVEALNSNHVEGFEQVSRIGVFGQLPEEPSPFEILNRQRQANSHPALERGVSGNTSVLSCGTESSAMLCGFDAVTDSANRIRSDTLDLDFVILVGESETQRCVRTRNALLDATSSVTHDVLLTQALEERNQRTAELAAAEFSEDDMLRLVRVLPGRHRGAEDPTLTMPNQMQQEVKLIFNRVLADAQAFFNSPHVTNTTLSFDRKDVLGISTRDYVAWFQGLALRDLVYISPLLARAPFYICYNTGVYQYVEGRYNLIENLMREQSSAWQSYSREDVLAFAASQLRSDADYRDCLREQFYFVMAHELGHLLTANQVRSQIATETIADCLGLIQTRRHTKFNLGVFSSLILTDADGPGTELLAGRRILLEKLSKDFDGRLPSNGAEAMQYCERWTASGSTMAIRLTAHGRVN